MNILNHPLIAYSLCFLTHSASAGLAAAQRLGELILCFLVPCVAARFRQDCCLVSGLGSLQEKTDIRDGLCLGSTSLGQLDSMTKQGNFQYFLFKKKQNPERRHSCSAVRSVLQVIASPCLLHWEKAHFKNSFIMYCLHVN